MSNIFTRLFCPDSAAEEDHNTATQKIREALDEVLAVEGAKLDPQPLVARPCAGCKGIFESAGLVPVQQVIIGQNDAIRVEGALYCRKCKPPTPFELVVEDDAGDCVDSMAFHLEHGWIQPVDDETGEERYIVSREEHNHLFCEQCGEVSDWTTCLDCRAQADVKVSHKSGKQKKA